MGDRADGSGRVVGTRADGCEVVCTLPEPALVDRVAMVKREILPHVRAQTRIADGFRLEFPLDSLVRSKLEQWVELERSCCGEARFEIDEQTDGLRFTVHGIDPTGALAELFGEAAS